MKRIILLTICCLPVLAFAQGGKYVVEGKVGTYSAPAKVYLRYFDKSSTHLDSAVMDNGKFRFEGTVASDPIMAFLTMDEKGKGPFGRRGKASIP
jgi:hypothetical protein